jgi:DNA-binding transcriptional ArsR family regulator
MWRRDQADVPRYADMLAALGAEPRLRIMRLLLSAHPSGMVVGEIHDALGIAGSTLSHHLEKLKNEKLVRVQREARFLRYSADAETLRKLLAFLCTECCTRSQAVTLRSIFAHAQNT